MGEDNIKISLSYTGIILRDIFYASWLDGLVLVGWYSCGLVDIRLVNAIRLQIH